MLAQEFVREVVVIDDGSTDDTAAVVEGVKDPRIVLHRQPVNLGKGAAVRFGLNAATSDFVAIQDADLEYDPAELRRLLGPLRDGRADVVYGSRFRSGDEHRVLLYWHSLGNKFLTTMSNVFTNLNLTDMETGYKVFRRDAITRLVIEENRFGMEPEVTAKVAALRLRIYEVGISYSGRTYGEGKKIGWKDGVRALYAIGKYAVASRSENHWRERVASFHEADSQLEGTLDSLQDAVNYNQWIADLVGPHLQSPVLEVGAGQGTISELLTERGLDVTAVEPSKAQCDRMRAHAGHIPSLSIVEGPLEVVPPGREFRSAVLVNVLEHIDDDVTFLREVADRCSSGANIAVWVPAHKVLYSEFDRRVGHFRRYSKARLRAAAESAHLEVMSLEFVNSVGALAWLSGVKILRQSPSAAAATGLFDRRIVPAVRRLEEGRTMPLGQSLLLVARVSHRP